MTKNIYFASDFHLGSPNYEESRLREDRIVKWLDWIAPTCSELFLMGDVFDFWFEYKYVVPKGFVRLQGKLAKMADSGIKIYFFKGNHDMWTFGYLEQELGITVISNESMAPEEAYRVFLSVLQVHGFSAIESADAVKVIPDANAKQNACSRQRQLVAELPLNACGSRKRQHAELAIESPVWKTLFQQRLKQ